MIWTVVLLINERTQNKSVSERNVLIMTKTELSNKLYEMSQERPRPIYASRMAAADALNDMITCVIDTLASGEPVNIVGFGSFEVKATAERMGRNPQTKEAVKIAPSKHVKFKSGKCLSRAVKGVDG